MIAASEIAANATVYRDLFMLNRVIPRHISIVVEARTYDAIIQVMGLPGTGYDAIALARAARDAARQPRTEFDADAERGPDYARAKGWI